MFHSNLTSLYLGFKALYVSGAAVSASNGVPDIGLNILNFIKKMKSLKKKNKNYFCAELEFTNL